MLGVESAPFDEALQGAYEMVIVNLPGELAQQTVLDVRLVETRAEHALVLVEQTHDALVQLAVGRVDVTESALTTEAALTHRFGRRRIGHSTLPGCGLRFIEDRAVAQHHR